jgi:hypothetical protein
LVGGLIFDQHRRAEDRAFQQGYAAGRRGAPPNPPSSLVKMAQAPAGPRAEHHARRRRAGPPQGGAARDGDRNGRCGTVEWGDLWRPSCPVREPAPKGDREGLTNPRQSRAQTRCAISSKEQARRAIAGSARWSAFARQSS